MSAETASEILRREVSKAALEAAGITPPNPSEAKRVDVSGPKNNTERWIAIPAAEGTTFSYNENENIAEVQRDSESFVRATARDGDIIVEDVKLGDEVTNRALRILQSSDEFDQALDNADVDDVMTDKVAANFDRESGITRAFVPTTLENGETLMLMAEIDENESLKSVYGLPSSSSGISTQDDDDIECWIGCISFGITCANVCTPCASAPTIPTCAPCAVCVGATAAAACARECDIPKFW
ncbi:hypothetical protein C485_06670 [Natrinema altunense JCM 12890]|uniref:Uncharacterized protein n=1 Tax=Natrinema altunense (strain JCM 12890 / CGMCC 1.3731 / AJ2) TaxID=1227494 RepID=L9ZLY6_NATA2|nr:hypothetical protein C485_06670 [Natrinema altunense JCM 12890]